MSSAVTDSSHADPPARWQPAGLSLSPRQRTQLRWVLLGVLAVGVLLLRLPLIRGSGYGPDPDAWRIALAGRTIASGDYAISRPPGYPAVELVAAATADAPPWLLCSLTALVGAVACACFARLLQILRVTAWLPLAIGLAVTPAVWLNSTTSMDYVWGGSLLLIGFLLLITGNVALASAAAGLAVAARPATAVLVPVLLLVQILGPDRRDLRLWLRLLLPLAVIPASLFSAQMLTYGPSSVHAFAIHATASQIVDRATVNVWGTAGWLAVAIGLGIGLVLVLLGRVEMSGPRRVWAVAALGGLVLQGLVFVALPDDPGYLVPAVPLVLLLIGLTTPVWIGVVVAGSIAASALLPAPLAARQGTVEHQVAQRRAELARLERVAGQVRSLPSGAVVVAGPQLPKLLALLHVTPPPDQAAHGPDAQLVVLDGGQVLRYRLRAAEPPAAGLFVLPGQRSAVGKLSRVAKVLG